MNYGLKLKEFRKKHELTQKDLSEIIKISVKEISEIENNKKELKADELKLLTSHFKITIKEFLTNERSNYYFKQSELELFDDIEVDNFKIKVIILTFLILNTLLSVLVGFYFDRFVISFLISFYTGLVLISTIVSTFLPSYFKNSLNKITNNLFMNNKYLKEVEDHDLLLKRTVNKIFNTIIYFISFTVFILLLVTLIIFTPFSLYETIKGKYYDL